MRIPFKSLFLLCGISLLTAGALTGWLVTVPEMISPSSFVGLLSLLAGTAWVTKVTYLNARPASSLAQSLHDIDAAERSDHLPRIG